MLYKVISDKDFNKLRQKFKEVIARTISQDKKIMELYLFAKPAIKKCYKQKDKNGLASILMWLIDNQNKHSKE